jgi:anti-anti-sigma factor
MPLNSRADADIAILSNFARLMNDPRYIDASRDASAMLDRGFKSFVLDLQGVREPGSGLLGLLTTLTRDIRRKGGEVVLAHLSPEMNRFMDEMRMDDYWDIFATVDEACAFFKAGSVREGE